MKRHFLVFLPTLLLLVSPTVARAQDAITELTVVYGGNSNVQCPATFTKYPMDLNHGAGGDFIYLCYKRGVGAPVTDITVAVTGSSVTHSPDPAWTLIPVDLNRNAGGFYVYLYYTKYPGQTDDPAEEPHCRTVRDIVVLVDSAPTPAGYVALPWDLNRGTDKHDHTLFFAVKGE
jgi:hypothetical protein